MSNKRPSEESPEEAQVEPTPPADRVAVHGQFLDRRVHLRELYADNVPTDEIKTFMEDFKAATSRLNIRFETKDPQRKEKQQRQQSRLKWAHRKQPRDSAWQMRPLPPLVPIRR